MTEMHNPPHPGEVLREWLADISVTEAAKRLGVTRVALSRVLNLCGAYLPANLRPPKLVNNPKGSWEPEEVVNLDERMLRQLGGAWNRVGFAPPDGDLALLHIDLTRPEASDEARIIPIEVLG